MGGIRFTETLTGYLGEGDDHWSAWRAGREAGRRAVFTVTVRIPDLVALEADPDHVAPAHGPVWVADVGRSTTDGRIHLFCRRDGQTRLLYDLPFSSGDRLYVLRGEKRLGEAREGRWREMTTLHVDLLRVEDGSQSLVARGVMRIGLWQVFLQTLSFRPEGSSNPVTFLRDWLRFLRFSSREMRA